MSRRRGSGAASDAIAGERATATRQILAQASGRSYLKEAGIRAGAREVPNVVTSEHQPALSACCSPNDDAVGLPGLNGQGANWRRGLPRLIYLAAGRTKARR
jgi:hypothetical protein